MTSVAAHELAKLTGWAGFARKVLKSYQGN
jgi:hypothetical protein